MFVEDPWSRWDFLLFLVSVLGIKAIWSLQPCRKCDSHHNNLIFVYIYIFEGGFSYLT